MEGKTITISVNEYKELLEASVRVEVFSRFVKGSKYNVDREDCARFLGFGIGDKED